MKGNAGAPRAHVVGAGLAGLSAACELAAAGWRVALYEGAGQAGGRCRSYHDAKLGCRIDNGNHLMLSANSATLAYLERLGARDSLLIGEACFPFLDLSSGERWTLRPNPGRCPWWLLRPARRVPGTVLGDYLGALSLARASESATVGECIATTGALWERFWEPLVVAALNTEAESASARLTWAMVRETFGRGGRACRPMVARDGLGPSLIEPALAYLEGRGAEFRFNTRLRGLEWADGRILRLEFGGESVRPAPEEPVILAVPPAVATELLPDLVVPRETRPIVNAHIRLPEARAFPAGQVLLGLTGGDAQWLFLRDGVASLTVSAATGLVDLPAEELATRLWRETALALNLDASGPEPPIRIVKERRATFAQTPAEVARRPSATTDVANLWLAGDWTDTGLPATIEGAIRSGQAAAKLSMTPCLAVAA